MDDQNMAKLPLTGGLKRKSNNDDEEEEYKFMKLEDEKENDNASKEENDEIDKLCDSLANYQMTPEEKELCSSGSSFNQLTAGDSLAHESEKSKTPWIQMIQQYFDNLDEYNVVWNKVANQKPVEELMEVAFAIEDFFKSSKIGKEMQVTQREPLVVNLQFFPFLLSIDSQEHSFQASIPDKFSEATWNEVSKKYNFWLPNFL